MMKPTPSALPDKRRDPLREAFADLLAATREGDENERRERRYDEELRQVALAAEIAALGRRR